MPMNKSRKISVRVKDSVSNYEKLMQDIEHNDETILLLPQNISQAGALGRSVSLVQLIMTWANSCQEPRIWTTLNPSKSENIEDFVSRVYGLGASYYAQSITGTDRRTELRRTLLEAAAPRVLAMSKRRYVTTAKGRLTELIFIRNARYEFHSAVYRRSPSRNELMDPERHGQLIVSPSEMNALLLKVLWMHKYRFMDYNRIKSSMYNRDDSLGVLLHEAFRNTAEHAYLDLNGALPTRNLRCISIAVHALHPHQLLPQTFVSAEHPGLCNYFQDLQRRADQGLRRLVHILEVSVLDAGPGFSATISARTSNEASDVECVSRCFRDYESSKSGENSGLGLGRVLSHVDSLDGFMRIRTSTTEAFFSRMVRTRGSNHMPHVVGNLPKAIGTALTIALPLDTL